MQITQKFFMSATRVLGAVLVVTQSVITSIVPTFAAGGPVYLQTTVAVTKDGSAPFNNSTVPVTGSAHALDCGGQTYNGSTNDGKDSCQNNGVVRVADTVTYRAEVAINDNEGDNVVATVTLNGDQKLLSIPLGCKTGSTLSLDKKTLTCQLGSNHKEGTVLAFDVVTQVSQLADQDDLVSASVSATADGGNTATDSSSTVLITKGFGVNMKKWLGYDPSYFAPSVIDVTNGGTDSGHVVTYQIDLIYDKGSDLLAHNGSNLASFSFTDIFGNNSSVPQNGAQLYLADPCGTNDGNGTVSCNAVMSGDELVTTINVNNVDVSLPNGGQNAFSIYVNIWVPRADVQTTAGMTLAMDNTIYPPVLSGTLGQVNSSETVVDDVVNVNLVDTNSGDLNMYVFFRGCEDGAGCNGRFKAGQKKVVAGETIVLQTKFLNSRKYNTKPSQCTVIDTSKMEFQGLEDTPIKDRIEGWNGEVNFASNPLFVFKKTEVGSASNNRPSIIKSDIPLDYKLQGPNSAYRFFDHKTAGLEDDFLVLEYSSDPLPTDIRTTTCDNSLSWTTDMDAVPGGRSAITRVRMTSNAKWTTLMNYFGGGDFNQIAIYSNLEVKIKNSLNVGDQVPVYTMLSDNQHVSRSEYVNGTNGYGLNPFPDPFFLINNTPGDPNYSLHPYRADRVTVVGASASIEKTAIPDSNAIFKGGDIITFRLSPKMYGTILGTTSMTITDTLPTEGPVAQRLSYIGGSDVYSGCGAGLTVTPGVGNIHGNTGVLTWTINGIDNSNLSDLCVIEFDVQVPLTKAGGFMSNNVSIDVADPAVVDQEDLVGNGTMVQRTASLPIRFTPDYGVSHDLLKTINKTVMPANNTWTYTLSYQNVGNQATSTGRYIEILPFNGDGSSFVGGFNSPRSPGSNYHGIFTLNGMPSGNGFDNTNSSERMFTITDPSSINPDPCHASNQAAGFVPSAGHYCYLAYINNGNTLPGAGSPQTTWCSYDGMSVFTPVVVGSDACPTTLSQVTAFRFAGFAQPVGGQARLNISYSLTAQGNQSGDIYTNSFGGRIPEIGLPMISNDVTITTVGGMIGDYIRNDSDQDGVQDVGEPALSGVSVQLWNSGTLISTGSSNASGYYEFLSIGTGTYEVSIVLPSGYIITDVIDDAVLTPVLTGSYTFSGVYDGSGNLTAIESFTGMDFGLFYNLCEVNGYVYTDLDGSDSFTAGDAVQNGVSVMLSGMTMTTNASGYYAFTGLDCGIAYEVSYDPNTATGNPDSSQDEAGTQGTTPFTGTVISVASLSGDNVSNNNNFGIVPLPLCEVNGYVYTDLDGSDSFTAGDAVQNGVSVMLSGMTMTTNASGYYAFTGLDCGIAYEVSYDPNTATGNPDSSQDEAGTQGTAPYTGTVISVASLSGDNVSNNNNFGIVPLPLCEVNGYVYTDLDGSDNFTVGDTVQDMVTVMLSGMTTTTNASGYYAFTGLDCGIAYEVSYDTSTATGNPDSTQDEAGTQGTAPFTGIVIATSTLSGDNVSNNNNFGLVPLPLCEVNGYVYTDVDGSDSFNAGDTVQNGVSVMLSGMTTTTNGSGYYAFTGLDCGVAYEVSYDTSTATGNPDSTQDEAGTQGTAPFTGIVIATSTLSGDNVSNDNNFGLVPLPLCEVNGYVYTDLDGSDSFTAGDAVQNGVSVMLSGMTTTTNGSGYYAFTGLDCGVAYEVSYDTSTATGNPDSTQDEDVVQGVAPFTGIVIATSTLSGDNVSNNNNFGLVPLIPGVCGAIVISGFLYDANNGGDALTSSSVGLCATGSVSGFSYSSITHSRSWECLGENGGPNVLCLVLEQYCGDGAVNNGEACDDGNTVDTDACSNSCIVAVCGDGVVNNGEACDDGNTTNTDACKNDCSVAVCGDSVIQDGVEQCDDGNANIDDSCNACIITTCGDMIIQSPNGMAQTELCDAGMSGSATCYGPNNLPAGETACTVTTCGDGVVQATNGEGITEQCDDGNTNEFDGCTSSCVQQLCETNGYIYLDLNNNQYYDRATDIAQVAVEVAILHGGAMMTTTTNASGYYEFTNLGCQLTYMVSYTNTTVYASDSAQLEDVMQTPASQSIDIPMTVFQDTSPYVSPNNNFGLTPLCELNGHVYVDTNNNSLYDVGSDVIATGIAVSLSNGTTGTTDVNGYYSFGGLSCFTSYVVSYVNSTSYVSASSQYEQTSQETNIMQVAVPASSFNPLADSVSPNNNFGLTPLCELNGYVYLDVNMNDVYDAGDTILSGVAMSLDGVSSTTTDSNGYYLFTGASCFVAHTVSYTNSTPYLSDSAQFEQSGQQSVVTVVTIPVGTFNPLGDSISPNNNFGLARYDLYIDKSVNDGYVSDGGIATYSITFGNHGSVDASGAVLRDYFDAAQIVPLPSSLQLGTLPVGVVATWASGSLTLTNLPILKSGDRYTISFQANVFGKDENIGNTTDIFVGMPETDPLEMSVFANNRDNALVKVTAIHNPAGGGGGAVVATPEIKTIVNETVKEEPIKEEPVPEAVIPVKQELHTLDLNENLVDDLGQQLTNLPDILPKTGSYDFSVLAVILLFLLSYVRFVVKY